jgi:hypothetical protein
MTERLPASLLFIGFLFLMSSCATVKFYGDETLTNETGLRIHYPRPYLLVEYDVTKTVNLKTSVVYLPDLQNPQYVRIKPGLGSSALKIALENGILSSYGLTTDTKMPETLGKVTDLLTRSTASVSDLVRNKTDVVPGQSVFELYEIVMTNGQTSLVRVQ